MKVPAYQLLVFFVHLCFQFIPHLFSFVSNVEELPRSLTLEVCFHPPSSLPRCPRIWTTLSADVWFFPRAFFNSCGWWKPGKDKNISDKPTRRTSNPTNRPEVPRPRQAEQSYLNPGKPAWPENRPRPITQRLKPRKEDPPTNKWKQLVKLPLLLVYHYHWTSFSWSCGDQSRSRSNSQPHTMQCWCKSNTHDLDFKWSLCLALPSPSLLLGWLMGWSSHVNVLLLRKHCKRWPMSIFIVTLYWRVTVTMISGIFRYVISCTRGQSLNGYK